MDRVVDGGTPGGRAWRIGAAVLLLFLPWVGEATGQSAPPPRELTLDPEVIGLAVTWAWSGADGSYWGVGGGVGSSLLSTMVLAGDHFSEEGWLSYEGRDGARDKLLVEMVHLQAFRRWTLSPRWDLDVGLRASVFLHADSSDDDFGGGRFVGAFGSLLFGTERFKIGPRLLVGSFAEDPSTRELGVFLSPLTGRIAFGL